MIESTNPNDTKGRSWRWLLPVTALFVLLLDQWSKTEIIGWLAINETWRPLAGTPVLELFAFTHIKNFGAAFGMFQSAGWFFVIVAIAVSIGILWYMPRIPRQQWWMFLILGLQLGGALGNLIDRLRLGWVTDFIHIGNFFIFNIADSAVVVGTLLLALVLMREDHQEKQRLQMQDSTPVSSVD